jgi:hypothetical protein
VRGREGGKAEEGREAVEGAGNTGRGERERRTSVIATHRQRLQTPTLVPLEAHLAHEPTNALETWLCAVFSDAGAGEGEVGVFHVGLLSLRMVERAVEKSER